MYDIRHMLYGVCCWVGVLAIRIIFDILSDSSRSYNCVIALGMLITSSTILRIGIMLQIKYNSALNSML